MQIIEKTQNNYFNILFIGQEFKNYKELCLFLNEETQAGNSKKSQLKEWSRYFSWENKGYKFIITNVYNEPKAKIDNRKYNGKSPSDNLITISNYILSQLKEESYTPMSISCWINKLNLINPDIYAKYYSSTDEEKLKFCEDNEVYTGDTELYNDFYGNLLYTLKYYILKSFNYLKRNGDILFRELYTAKIYDGKKYRYESLYDCNDIIEEIENDVCNVLIAKHYKKSKIKGKQLLYIARYDNEIIQNYIESCKDRITARLIQDGYLNKGDCLFDYYKSYSVCVTNLIIPQVDKDEVLNIIRSSSIKRLGYMKDSNKQKYNVNDDNFDEEILSNIKKLSNLMLAYNKKQTIINTNDFIGKVFKVDMKYASLEYKMRNNSFEWDNDIDYDYEYVTQTNHNINPKLVAACW